MADYTLFLALQPNCSYPYLLDFIQFKCDGLVLSSFRVTSSTQRHPEIPALEDRFGPVVLDESLESLERQRDAVGMMEGIGRVHIGKGLCALEGEWLDCLAQMYGWERSLILWYADAGYGLSTFTEYQQFIDSQPSVPSPIPAPEWPFGLGPAHISLSFSIPQIVDSCPRLPHFNQLISDATEIARKRSRGVCDAMERRIGTAVQGLQQALEHQVNRKIQRTREYQDRSEAVTTALKPCDFQPQAALPESVSARLDALRSRISALQATMQARATHIAQQQLARSNPYPVQICQAQAVGFDLQLIVANYKPLLAYVLYRLEGEESEGRVLNEGIRTGMQTVKLERVLLGRRSLSVSLWSVQGADYVRISPSFSVTVSKAETVPHLLSLPPEVSSEADTSAQSSLDLVGIESSDSGRAWTSNTPQMVSYTATVGPMRMPQTYYPEPLPLPIDARSQMFLPDASTFYQGMTQFPMHTLQPPQIFPLFDPNDPRNFS